MWFALVEAQGIDFVSMISLVWSYPDPLALLQVSPKAELGTPQNITTNVYSQIYSISVKGKPSCECTLAAPSCPSQVVALDSRSPRAETTHALVAVTGQPFQLQV